MVSASAGVTKAVIVEKTRAMKCEVMAARTESSPPLCGEGWGVGVHEEGAALRRTTPLPALPHKGGGSERPVLGKRKRSLPAFAFVPVGAQRIKFAGAVQVAGLRRDRDQEARAGDQDGLAHLPVPGAKALPLPLESRDQKFRAAQIGGEH